MSLTKRIPEVLGLVAALVLAGGCETLNIKNPNAPDTGRALGDPSTVEAIAAGALRTWFNTTQNMDPGGILVVGADSHTAPWNNFQIRFYTGCTDAAGPTHGTCGVDPNKPANVAPNAFPRTSWQNDPTAAERLQIEVYWYGYYSALSSASDVVRAITKGLVITDDETTTMVETVAVLAQALSLSGLALNYDKGFLVDENTPLDVQGLPILTTYVSRTVLRDAALAKFDDVINILTTTDFTVPATFFGSPSVTLGNPFLAPKYTNVEIAQIANTMAARTLAYFPRNATENADISAGGVVDWARVASYASKGISTGTPFDWIFQHDGCVNWCDYLKAWSNDMRTMRIHTRVAAMMDASQETPFPTINPKTALAAPITGSASPQTVTPDNMTRIATGRQLAIGGAGSVLDTVSVGPPLVTTTTKFDDEERFVVTGTTPTTFTAVATKNHPSTTLTGAAITAAKTYQTVTPASMADIQKASVLYIGRTPDPLVDDTLEAVTVKSVTATTFTAVFTKNHPAGTIIGAPVNRNGGGPGNPQPNRTSGALFSPDKRLGDGTYTYPNASAGNRTITKAPGTINRGTDYAWSTTAQRFPAARGSWRQSNIGQIRYITLSEIDPNGSAFGFGSSPIVLRAENDLLWAEGLIRSGGDLVLAAAKINNSRQTRGGLSAAPSAAGLLADLQYEQDVELPGSNAAPFYNQRRITPVGGGSPGTPGLEQLTAHEMPVPAKELQVLGLPLYTWGGTSPPNSSPTAPALTLSTQNAQQIWAELEHRALMPARAQPSPR